MGQTGPMRLYAGFGTMAAAIAGFYPVTGWPDRIPAGPFTAYTDYISPRLSVVLIMAALEHRHRTGQGQHIDFSQLEGALHFLAPQLLDEEINGRTAGRHGNADPHMTPHAVFPRKGRRQVGRNRVRDRPTLACPRGADRGTAPGRAANRAAPRSSR